MKLRTQIRALHAGFSPGASGTLSNGLVIVSTGVFLLLSGLNLGHVLSWSRSFTLFGLSRAGVFEELWLFQFITAPFVHGSLTHLAFNMLSLWMLGPSLERALGRKRYVVLTLACALSASVGFLILSSSGAVFMGYSGVIFGILTAHAMLFPDTTLFIFAFFPLKMKQAVLLLGTVELYLTLTSPNAATAHMAHLFGALAGFAYLRYLRLRAKRRASHFSQSLPEIPKQTLSRYVRSVPREL